MSWGSVLVAILSLYPLLLCCASAYSWKDGKPSAYEALEQYDLPVGLLPQGAAGYDLNPTTGEFTAYLNVTSCDFTVTNFFRLMYESPISGLISTGRLNKLRGVSVKVVKVWLQIREARRNGDILEFSVGVASTNFPVADFSESPRCGCGFNCGTGGLNLFAASS